MEDFQTHILSNGLRILHVHSESPISYIGVAINAGTRDELPEEWGMAHFVEHMLFKGTSRRKSWHIINRLESVGGQIDAYTTKEDTFIYATVPTLHTDRALELISDVLFNSILPKKEIEKEKDIVLDEIQSYNDSPSELIYDDFEQALFPNDTIGRNILGSKQSIESFNKETIKTFMERCYTTDQMVLFYMGEIPYNKLIKRIEKHFSVQKTTRTFSRKTLQPYIPFETTQSMDTFQAHSIIGTVFEPKNFNERLAHSLLNNILGGPNMSSMLNMSVRERNGLAYLIESGVTYYSDMAVWSIYYGCDAKNQAKARKLALHELETMAEKTLKDTKLQMYKTQLKGQVLIGNQNREFSILSMAKSHLHSLPLLSDTESLNIIDQITPEQLRQYAQKLFQKDRLSYLTFL